MNEADDEARFYFSFRSPYAWLAAESLSDAFAGLPVSFRLIPVFPAAENFPNDPARIPNKIRHLVKDVARLAGERGITVKFPQQTDPVDWAVSHAAFVGAQRLEQGTAFMLQAFRARFVHGCDLGDDKVIADAAARAGLDPERILEFAHDAGLQNEVRGNFQRGIEEDRIFGVPTFIYRGDIFWGHDRMRFVRQAIEHTVASSASSGRDGLG